MVCVLDIYIYYTMRYTYVARNIMVYPWYIVCNISIRHHSQCRKCTHNVIDSLAHRPCDPHPHPKHTIVLACKSINLYGVVWYTYDGGHPGLSDLESAGRYRNLRYSRPSRNPPDRTAVRTPGTDVYGDSPSSPTPDPRRQSAWWPNSGDASSRSGPGGRRQGRSSSYSGDSGLLTGNNGWLYYV